MNSQSNWSTHALHACLFLGGVSALVWPLGYALAPLMISLLGLYLLLSSKPYCYPKEDVRVVLGVAAACGLYGLVSTFISIALGTHWHIVGPHLPFLIYPLMAWAFIKTPNINGRWLVWGAATGALLGFTYAAFMHFYLGIDRPSVHRSAITFGNTGVLMAGICWLGMVFSQNKRHQWILLICGAAGIGVSLLSGSRGGWLSIVILMIMMWSLIAKKTLGRWRWPALALVCAAFAAIAISPKLPVNERIQQAVHEVKVFIQDGENNTSVGARLAMWTFAASIAHEKPIWGFGYQGKRDRWQEAIEAGVYTSPIGGGHFHNEMIERYITTGLVGLGLTLLVYAAGFRAFYIYRQGPTTQQNPYALMGFAVLVMYLEFGLSDVIWSVHANRQIFLFLLISLVGLAVAHRKAHNHV